MVVRINGYEINTDEKHVAAQGFWYVATKGGKKYFLKQYNPARPIPPSEGGGSEKVYAKNIRNFQKRVEYRTRINQTIRTFSMSGGNIVIPVEEFVCQLPDESGKNLYFYWEATELIPNVIPDDELESFIATLSPKQKFMIMATAAGALNTVHQHKIVHSDLKLGNVLLAKNSSGNIVTKLIDFDGSYFLDDKDTLIAGDEVYCSPELLQFYSEEEDDSEYRAALNEKSDIFSLGLIFHFYLAGYLPVGVNLPENLQKQKAKGRIIHCSEVLLCGGKLEISDKILSLNHRLLIQDMLQLDPAKRPTAIQVLNRLKEPELEFSVEEPWPEHNIVIKVDRVRAANYVVLRKITDRGINKYELISKSGNILTFTKEELISKGLAECAVRRGEYDKPWPEHNVSWNIDKIEKKGFVTLKRTEFKASKGYTLYRADNSHQFFIINNMLMYEFATKKSDVVEPKKDEPKKVEPEKVEFKTCEPWPEHNITFNSDVCLKHGFVRAERGELNGKKSYYFYASNGTKRFIMLNMLLTLGLVQKK